MQTLGLLERSLRQDMFSLSMQTAACGAMELTCLSNSLGSIPFVRSLCKGKGLEKIRAADDIQERNKSHGIDVLSMPFNRRLGTGDPLWRATPGERKGDMIASISGMEVRSRREALYRVDCTFLEPTVFLVRRVQSSSARFRFAISHAGAFVHYVVPDAGISAYLAARGVHVRIHQNGLRRAGVETSRTCSRETSYIGRILAPCGSGMVGKHRTSIP